MKKNKFKILSLHSGYQIGAKGYRVDKYTLDGKLVEHIGNVIDPKYAKFAGCKLTRRLMRAELTGLYALENGDMIAIGKKGLFLRTTQESGSKGSRFQFSGSISSPTGGGDFHKVFAMPRGSKPLNLCVAKSGHIFFGEYYQNIKKQEVNIYGSMDGGRNWKVVYTFDAGNINHVHGIFYDKYTSRMWVLTGDRKNECIIGYTEDEFKTFHEVLRGGQEYRSCQLFFYKDFIVYATDSQYIENEIRAIDRNTLKITTLAKIQGSAIKGGQTGNISYLSTTIEPSEVNKDRFAHIWATKDGLHWEDKFKAEKDHWPSIFQFGTFEFPQNAYHEGRLWFSGRALKGYDNKSSFIEI